MKMNTKLKHLPIAALATVGLTLAGCGGGGGMAEMADMDATDAMTVALADLPGKTVAPGTIITVTPEELEAIVAAVADIDVPADGYAPGDMVTIPGIGVLTCTGDDNCSVEVAADGTITTVGTIEVAETMMGGDPTTPVDPMTPVDPPAPTPTEQLAVAEQAVAHAQAAVDGLSASSTPAEIAAANSALAAALTEYAVVSAIPEVAQILTQRILDGLRMAAAQRTMVVEALATAQAAVDALTDESTDEAVSAARALVMAAQTALDDATALSVSDSADLDQLIGAVDTDLGGIETARSDAAEAAYKVALGTVTTAIETAKGMVDALTNESTTAAVTAATNAVEAAQTALDDAELSPEDTTTQQAAITGLSTTITAGDMGRTGHRAAVATAKVEAATKAAGTKVKAITAEAAQVVADDAGLGGSDALGTDGDTGTDDDPYSLTIARDRDGTTVKIADSGMAGADDPKFEQAMDFGGGRTMHVRALEADDEGNVVEEVVVVSTDIGAPKATKFATVEMLTARKDRETEDAENPNDSITVEAGTGDVNLPKIMASGFAAAVGSSVVHTFQPSAADADTDTQGLQPRDAAEVAGTYDGAMGTYTCDGADDCTVTVDGKGAVTGVSTGWTFTPATGATIDVADADYLSYGFWLKRTTDADGVLEYNEVETFASVEGIDPTGNTGLDDVLGIATYKGGAVGVYVKNVLDNQANITTATSGHFKADVELNASFGGGAVPANDQFTIGGTITDFVLSGGEENDWAVGLGLADFSERPLNDPGKSVPGNTFTDMFNGVATGDSTAAAGSWNGAFHGSSADFDHDMDGATDPINRQPVAVVGEFNANFTDGTTAGAFGATK